jgi:radical SAM protein with 4Fe4S-binding SPASM domain
VQVNLSDVINLLSKLDGKRLVNLSKLWVSYHISRLFRKPFHWGMPAFLDVEPTTSCNLRCPQCISGLRQFSRETGMLDLHTFKQVVDELHPNLIWLALYWQGEPFLNTQFLEFVKYASNKNIYTSTSSNAHYFTDEMARATVESGLDRLIVSIDGVTQESYEKYRIGGKLEKVLEGTTRLLKWKKELNSQTPNVIWQFIVFKHNEQEVPIVKKMAKEMGVDELHIKTAQVYDYAKDEEFIPTQSEKSRYKKMPDGTFQIKNDFLNKCWRMWRSSVITWDGMVVPCCFDKDAHHRLGTVTTHSFKEIWQGESYNRFRNTLLKSRKEIEMCLNCTEGTT